MSVYGFDITHASRDIKKGLAEIAKAIDNLASKPTYNVIVNTSGDSEAITKAVADAIERIEKRTK